MIEIRTKLYETEDVDKLKKHLEEAFGIRFEISGSELIGKDEKLDCLSKMREQIKSRGIEPTVREVILTLSKREQGTKIKLNKQAICKGIFNFIEEDLPLGAIEINIDLPPEEVLNFLGI